MSQNIDLWQKHAIYMLIGLDLRFTGNSWLAFCCTKIIFVAHIRHNLLN